MLDGDGGPHFLETRKHPTPHIYFKSNITIAIASKKNLLQNINTVEVEKINNPKIFVKILQNHWKFQSVNESFFLFQ